VGHIVPFTWNAEAGGLLEPCLGREGRRQRGRERGRKEDLKSFKLSQALVAHAYNPSYSGGRDQEACGSKPVPVNSW
jgi:hypothetical protein